MKFYYSLKPINELIKQLLEENSISWYHLTDGCYSILFDNVKLFEYTDNVVVENNMISNNLDYYVIRIVEDIFEVLINTINPMPNDLFELINSIEKRNKIELRIEEVLKNLDEKEYLECLDLFKLTCQGCIDTAYLNPGFNNYFFHVNDDLFIFYDCETNDKVWTAKKGIIKINYNDFVVEFKQFVNNFMKDMKERINETICLLDKSLFELDKEHEERLRNYIDMFKRIDNHCDEDFDEWDNVIKLAKKYKIF